MKYQDVERILKAIKMDDENILDNDSITINKYGKSITIRQLNWFKQWGKFTHWMNVFLQCFATSCEAMELPDSKKDLKSFRQGIRLTISNSVWGKSAFKALEKMCGLYAKKSWMRANFTVDDWCEMFLYVYAFNLMGVKKNLSTLFQVIKKIQSH